MKNGENGKRLIFPHVFGWVNEKVEEFFFGLAEEKSERMEKIVYIITHISLLKKKSYKKKKTTNQPKNKKAITIHAKFKKEKKMKRKQTAKKRKEKKRKGKQSTKTSHHARFKNK